MKIAVTDACIFIDLYDLNLTDAFFSLQLEIHTSIDVLYELYKEQQNNLAGYIAANRLTTHKITAEEKLLIQATQYPKSLSDSDKTVLFLASKLDALGT